MKILTSVVALGYASVFAAICSKDFIFSTATPTCITKCGFKCPDTARFKSAAHSNAPPATVFISAIEISNCRYGFAETCAPVQYSCYSPIMGTDFGPGCATPCLERPLCPIQKKDFNDEIIRFEKTSLLPSAVKNYDDAVYHEGFKRRKKCFSSKLSRASCKFTKESILKMDKIERIVVPGNLIFNESVTEQHNETEDDKANPVAKSVGAVLTAVPGVNKLKEAIDHEDENVEETQYSQSQGKKRNASVKRSSLENEDESENLDEYEREDIYDKKDETLTHEEMYKKGFIDGSKLTKNLGGETVDDDDTISELQSRETAVSQHRPMSAIYDRDSGLAGEDQSIASAVSETTDKATEDVAQVTKKTSGFSLF